MDTRWKARGAGQYFTGPGLWISTGLHRLLGVTEKGLGWTALR